MASRSIVRAAAMVVALAWSAAAAAQPRVVLVETRGGPALPALAAQLGVHAGGVTIVRVDAEPLPLPEAAAQADALLAEHDAALVLWIGTVSSATGATTVVVSAAGPRRDRALIELIRIDAAVPASELERTIALKVAGLLDAALSPRPAANALGASPRIAARWRLALGAEAVAGGDRSLAAGPSLTGGRRWVHARWTIDAELAARWLVSGTIEGDGARVDVDEVAVLAGGSLGHTVGRTRVFAAARVGAALALADGASADGRTGSASVVIPVVALGVGVAVPLSASELVLGAGVQRALIRQRFLVDDTVAADLGTSGLTILAALAVRL